MTDLNDDVERVLRAAGGRVQPSAQIKASVRAAVHAQWQEVVGQRRRRQRRIWFAAAAGLAVAALGITMVRTILSPAAVIVASISHSSGEVRSRHGTFARWQPVRINDPVHDGDIVVTESNSRVALALANGISLRLDQGSRVEVEDAEHVKIRAGGLYVDAGPLAGPAKPLEVGTPAGAVRHLGTQYEVRLVDTGTQLRVREGRVELLQTGGDSHPVEAGEQIVVSHSGSIKRGLIARSGADWDWVARTAPAFDIDGRSLREFLSWAGRELGREVVFATPDSEAEANRVVLSGSVSGLTPSEAIAAVLPTTPLRSFERNDQIVVTLGGATP
jgi:ferric-dicitrate binding protein FerR (iron transport regulator)